MLSFFRSVTKSKIGTAIMVAILVAILAGFAAADLQNFGSGNIGFGMGSSTLAEVGDQQVSEREMSEAMQRRLQEVRTERPDADYAAIAGDFETILSALIDQRTMIAFANANGFHLSKRLIDAEIAQIPAAKGLNGEFSQDSYDRFLSQQRLTDAQVRQIIAGGLLQRLLLTPVATNARATVGMATPYASMLLEAREGEAAIIPVEAFARGLEPTDSELQRFYAGNRNRYMVPEQRSIRIARIGSEQVSGITASDQEIAAYYNANKATYAPRDSRTLTQVVVPDQASAKAIATRAKAGATIASAAAPAGTSAAVTRLEDQSRADYAGVAGDKAASAVFTAPVNAVVGPLQSDFGWVVVKVEGVKAQSGKSLAQARAEIASKLNVDKRKQAVEDLVDKVQTTVDDGGNFSEAVTAAKLAVTTTPLITANGNSLARAGYETPAELAPAIKAGFEIAPNDPPEIVSLGEEQGYALISPAQVVPAAPAPLADIRGRVATDWINDQAAKRARAAAEAIAAKTARGVPLAQAVNEAKASLPAVRPIAARRIQIATAKGPVPPGMKMMFTLAEGKSRMGVDPQGRGFFVVKVNKITPGNALLQPGLINEMQGELQQSLSQDYVQQFLASLRAHMKATRNESAIQALKARLVAGGG